MKKKSLLKRFVLIVVLFGLLYGVVSTASPLEVQAAKKISLNKTYKGKISPYYFKSYRVKISSKIKIKITGKTSYIRHIWLYDSEDNEISYSPGKAWKWKYQNKASDRFTYISPKLKAGTYFIDFEAGARRAKYSFKVRKTK